MTFRLIFASLLMSLLITMGVSAKDTYIRTYAKEELTGLAVGKVRAWLVSTTGCDTIHAKVSLLSEVNSNGEMKKIVSILFKVPDSTATYTLTAVSPGYDDIIRELTVKKYGRREFEREIPDLIFNKKSKMLDEVSVTASKVKFFIKGDTMVYNADAFQLPEGSMLDALVKQLPGVEIRDNGQIYVNGKFVESLLLNGKDFFQDNALMLNNLGAYTVKDVAVYDKYGELSRLAGRDLGDSQYVMDVRLKRDYMSGYVCNLEAGVGTDERYLGRLFGMWYTVRSQVALIGNVNNLNDSRRPGQNDHFSGSKVPGDLRTQMGGLTYNINGDRWEFTGNTIVKHVRNRQLQTADATYYVGAERNYENRFSNSHSRNLEVSTQNNLHFRPGSRYIGISQTLDYNKNDHMGQEISGMFNDDIKGLTESLLKEIYSGQASSFAGITMNSALSESMSNGHSLKMTGRVEFDGKVSHSPDLYGVAVSGSYSDNSSADFNRYSINYNKTGKTSTVDTYTNNALNRSWNVGGGLNYEYLPTPDISLNFNPGYGHSSSKKDSRFYQLDRLEDAGIFGTLPDGYPATLDENQSYVSTETGNNVSLNMSLIGEYSTESGGEWKYQITPYFSYRWRSLDYRQVNYNQNVVHNSLNIELLNSYVSYRKGRNRYKLTFNRNSRPVPLSRLVSVTDNRDPLNIYGGAPSLKNAFNNDIELSWERRVMGRHRWTNRLSATYEITENALVSGVEYNEESGVRTFRMYNVSGNWSAALMNSLVKTFGAKDQFDISTVSNVGYIRDVNVVSAGSNTPIKSMVGNLGISQSVKLNWRIGRQNFGIFGQIDFRNTGSDSQDFENFSATIAQYGINARIDLPYNFSISTDLNMYTRRGYAYSELNTTDVVWNTNLTCAPKGSRWVFMLDGFDLLHQLSNVTYNVNAKGRTETFTNVLPRYVLFHIQYRFTVQPKKK